MNIESTFLNNRPTTDDRMFSGTVSCRQYRDGYRFSVDAILAAHFHTPNRGETVLDLGAGCGIISLILMHRWGELLEKVDALEFQPQLCHLIEENFRQNGVRHKCCCLQGDVKNILEYVQPESYSLVICNPPYYPANTGRKSKGDECSIARHLLTADLDDFTRSASLSVKNGGTVVFIYPAELLTSLCGSLARYRLEIKQLQCIYSYPHPSAEARLVRVRCVKNGGKGAKVLAPFYIYESKNGQFSDQMQQLYAP